MSSPDFANIISFPFPGKKVRDRKKHIATYFDELQKSIFDSSFLEMVAVFEKIAFSKIDNASGEIRRVVKDGYSKAPFRENAVSFVKDKEDVYNLSGLKKLVEGRISNELSDHFSEILEHRNYLAHGKRGIGKKSTLSIEEIYEILEEVLRIINR